MMWVIGWQALEKAINDCENSCHTFRNGESGDKVYGDVGPRSGGSGERLKQTSGRFIASLV